MSIYDPQDQTDLIARYMAETGDDRGQLTTDEVELPGLHEMFEGPPLDTTVTRKKVALPVDLNNLAQEPRKNIAVALSHVWKTERKLVGLEWDVNSKEIFAHISDSPIFQQRTLRNEEVTELLDRLVLIMKLRPNIQKIKWEFGKRYVEIEFIPPR